MILETKERLHPSDFHCVIVPDQAAGRRARYTVYRIPTDPSQKIKIVGRELPLTDARKIAYRAQYFL